VLVSFAEEGRRGEKKEVRYHIFYKVKKEGEGELFLCC